MSIDKAIKAIKRFQGESLTKNLAKIEADIVGAGADDVLKLCAYNDVNNEFIESALEVKKIAGQINVIIHASGILHALNGLLKPGEVVESVSLGAGNTGKKFDLETNYQVAEFKFIDWRGGSESIRQNGIFKDFYELAEYKTKKNKFLYVVDTHYPLKFLNGGRAITSILSKQPVILADIKDKYGYKVNVARDYYEINKNNVHVVDISPYIGRA